MIDQQNLMNQIMEQVTQQVVEGIQKSIGEIIEKELSTNLTKALIESEFYRRISDDMRTGLQSIYKEISDATKPENSSAVMTQQRADKLFSEASEQLDEILQTIERATVEIMDIVEKHIDLQNRASEHLNGLRKTRRSNPAISELISINDELGENLINIMTSLSFQDLTGQRIKKIIGALKKIETTVFDLYVSTGLIIKAREEAPDKDLDELQRETKQKVSELKGPVSDVSQDNIDDLLSQLGLE